MRQATVFLLLLLWCVALYALRVERSGSLMFGFLLWNLFLALIPWLASLYGLRRQSRRFPTAAKVSAFAIWLLFLPNAPYILTDLLHLRPRSGAPLWFDLALLLSCAGTGLLLGYASLLNVERVVEERFGRVAAHVTTVTALMLSAFGIYLGRFLRWNSWDVVTDPRALLSDVAARLLNPFAHPRTLAVTAIYGIALVLGYLACRAIPYGPCPNPPIRRWDDSTPSTSARRS